MFNLKDILRSNEMNRKIVKERIDNLKVVTAEYGTVFFTDEAIVKLSSHKFAVDFKDIDRIDFKPSGLNKYKVNIYDKSSNRHILTLKSVYKKEFISKIQSFNPKIKSAAERLSRSVILSGYFNNYLLLACSLRASLNSLNLGANAFIASLSGYFFIA